MTDSSHFLHDHLIDAADLSREDIAIIFDRAQHYLAQIASPRRQSSELAGLNVVLAFFEPSTRTRVSFELAAKRLSAEVISFQSAASSMGKGESLLDTIYTIEAMHVDILVLRHLHSGAPHFLRPRIKSRIINAGDGQHEHPTQALLDAFTLHRRLGELRGVKICFIGDVLHSRVARSCIRILLTLGAEIAVCSPATLLPAQFFAAFNVRAFNSVAEALQWSNVVNVLRIQRERMLQGLFPTLREYANYYGVHWQMLEAYPDLLVMHPGPMNRGVELSADVADAPRSLIRNQVESGVAIRMAVLALIAANRRGRRQA